MLKYRQLTPRSELDIPGCSFGQNARQVLGDAAAGDVGHGVDSLSLDQATHDWPIALVRSHQFGTGFVFDLADEGFRRISSHFKEELACERISVGMESVRGKTYDYIPDLDSLARDDAIAFDDAHDEAGDVVLSVRIKARHLGGLASDQSAAVLTACICQT